MPASVVHTPHEEKLWDRAKKAVEQSKLKKHTKFNDQDWGLVMHIFQGMKKKEAKSALVAELGKLGIPVVGEFVKRSSIKATLAAIDKPKVLHLRVSQEVEGDWETLPANKWLKAYDTFGDTPIEGIREWVRKHNLAATIEFLRM